MTYTASSIHPTIAEINLQAFQQNIRELKKGLHKTKLLAVVKTNAYGHGLLEVSKAAVAAGADQLGVTSVEAGTLLRNHGIKIPIQLLSTILSEQAAAVVANDLTAAVFTEKLARKLSGEAVLQNKTVSAHLKIDTGLHRFGIAPETAQSFCEHCYHLPHLKWEGIYTHFSSADEGDWVTTEQQYTVFIDTIARLRQSGYTFSLHHAGGSTIAIERSDMHLDMVRPGIALFGYHPAHRQHSMIELKPVMKLTTNIIHIMELPANTPVGYGGNYLTKGAEKLAILPIGHGDGYKRALSNKGEVLINSQRAKIVGTISLDQTVIDITDIPHVYEGDEVVLIGKMGDEEITAQEIANWLESIVDEVVSSLMERITRKYIHS